MDNFSHTLTKLQQLHAQHPSFANNTLLALSEAGSLNLDAEAQLDQLSIKSYLGQAPDDLLALQTLLRKICEKDMAFGLSYCLTSFMAATNVWLAGNNEQQALLTDIFANNGVISVAYHEPEHGNDLAANQFSAKPTEGGFLLSGQKHVINNVHRADAIVVFAKTAGAHPARQHSLFFIPREYLDNRHFSVRERVSPQGVNGCHITGFDCNELFIPSHCLLGEQGAAIEYALRAFQITRTLLPGISLGAVQTAFEQVSAFAEQRVLYSKSIAALPHVRDQLAICQANLLIANAMTEGLTRGLHLCPDKMAAYSAANKYFVPKLMRQTLKQLASVYGARYFLRGSLFEKILRDYQVVNFGHAGSLVCQASLVSQLDKLLAENNQTEVWLWQAPLPQFDIQALRLGVRRGCVILASLQTMPEKIANCAHLSAEDKAKYQLFLDHFASQFHALTKLALNDDNAGLASYRYCLLLAATCLLQQSLSAPVAPMAQYQYALQQIQSFLKSPYADFKCPINLGIDSDAMSAQNLSVSASQAPVLNPFYYSL